MNELNLLFTAIAATIILHFFSILFNFFQQNKKPRTDLSLKFLSIFGIEQYAICEKILCLTVKISTALIFIAAFEFLSFESNYQNRFYIGLICGIAGISMMKYLFLAAVKFQETHSLDELFFGRFFGFLK